MTHIRSARRLHFVLAALLSTLPVVGAQDAGRLPDSPNDLTLDNQVQFANLVLADPRPVVAGEDTGEYSYYFRRLKQEFKMPVKFTWDAGAVKFLTDKHLLLEGVLQDLSADLVGRLSASQASPLKGPLSKVKEIRLTTTTKPWSKQGDITGDGFFPTFNKANGLLTVALSTTSGVNRDAQGSPFSDWIIANVK